jgi:hypothetical protein
MINDMERRLIFSNYFESQLRDFIITPSQIYAEKVPFYNITVLLKLTTCKRLLGRCFAQFLGQ